MEILCSSPITLCINGHGIIVSTNLRYRLNWIVLYMVTTLNGITPFIQIPSLHQYITSSNNHTINNNLETSLQLSESWYSIIVSIGNIGTFIGALCYGLLSRHVYVKPGILTELTFNLIGGLLYSFGYNGWFILFSRLFTGMFTGIHMSLMRVYIFETSDKLIQLLPRAKRQKSTIKYTAIFILLIHGVIGRALAPVIVAIAAQVSFVSEFHWPGYYISVHSFIMIVFVLVTFNEEWSDIRRANKETSSIKQKILADIKNPSIPHYLSFLFVYLLIMLGWNVSIVETILNPVLSDQFGLDIKTTSYVLIGGVSVYLISVIIMYCCQKFHISNRNILIGSIIISIIGTLIMTDWQSIGGDPCNQFNDDEITDYNTTELSYYCEQFSNDTNNCFWNPISRITGDHCDRCRPVCLSDNHSLNFIQLFIGVVMVSFCVIPGRVLSTTIASDKAGGNSHGIIMGGLIAAGALSQALGPLWTNSTYLTVNHHTWLPMILLAIGQLIGLTLLLIFYKKMKKTVLYSTSNELSTIEEDNVELLVLEDLTEL